MNISNFVVVTICSLLFVVHICVIGLLVKTKNWSASRFLSLALYLSISDAVMMVETIWQAVVRGILTESTRDSYHTQCIILYNLTSGTVTFSLLQTLFICFERLNATFTVSSLILRRLTSNVAVGVGFLIVHLYVLIRYLLDVFAQKDFVPSKGCDIAYTFQKEFLHFNEIPKVLLVFLIAGCYVTIIIRIVKRKSKVFTIDGFTELQEKKRKKAAKKMRSNVITLSCIIVVSVCSIIPRTVYGLYVQNFAVSNEETPTIAFIVNCLLLLNPVCDPFIYILRLNKLRESVRDFANQKVTLNLSVSNVNPVNDVA
ncbi:unnamed protein product [Mytilus edulis]|uniref:G-protein coupled receptors family 1 profile domain-containing protein n=1 Tax=Mytilus edulis TaxID=6550 RepID=A0A8S3SN98_MYTED|nr:unnamed protein product [Mytilus edulis]